MILTVGRERKQYTPEEAIKRGQAVQRLLADDTFRQIVMEETADECMNEWASGKTAEDREAAHMKLRGLRAIEAKLQAILDQAAITADSLRKKERRAKEI